MVETSFTLFFVLLYFSTGYTDSGENKGNVSNNRAPWYVGIYSKIRKQQICGGTLVSETEVISAAHCFWSVDFGPLASAQFAVAAGSQHRPWNDTRDHGVQHFDVDAIIFPDRFSLETYQDDIAIVKLNRPVIYSASVSPICVDFNEDLEREQLNGKPGTMVGWGLTEDRDADSLSYMELQFVNKDECAKETEPSAVHALYDKICAGDQERKYICKNSAGSGLTYSHNSISYLKGVSTANQCRNFKFTTFTNLVLHRTFLRHNIEDLEKCDVETNDDRDFIDDDRDFIDDDRDIFDDVGFTVAILFNPVYLLLVFSFVFAMAVYASKRKERITK